MIFQNPMKSHSFKNKYYALIGPIILLGKNTYVILYILEWFPLSQKQNFTYILHT